MLNIFRKIASKIELESYSSDGLIHFSVGKKVPFNVPMGVEGGVCSTFRCGYLNIIISVPNLTSEEIKALGNICIGLGIYNQDDFPWGVLTFQFLFSESSVWPIITPLTDDIGLEGWVNRMENNIVQFTLVEHTTQIIKEIRTLLMPRDFMFQLRECWSNEMPNFSDYTHFQSNISGPELWDRSLKWIYDPQLEEFVHQ